MSRLRTPVLCSVIVLVLLASWHLAGAHPPPTTPARLAMDPPTQAELTAQAGLAPTGVAPLIRGAVFYDQAGDGSAGSPQCDRGQRDLTLTLYRDVDANGVYSPTVDTFVAAATTDIIGDYLFEALPAPANYLVMLDVADPDLPPGSVTTTASPPSALRRASTRPPIASTRPRTTASPIPIPPAAPPPHGPAR